MMVEALGKVASSAMETLKNQPLMVVLLAINIIFLVVTVLIFKETASAAQRRDTLITTLMQSCFQQLNK